MNLEEIFKENEKEYLKFDRIEQPLSRRPDVCAFLLLDVIIPPDKDTMVSCADHDEIFLDVDIEKLADLATEEQIRDLVRCGVRLAPEGLAMFV